jgi:hypothetical protein
LDIREPCRRQKLPHLRLGIKAYRPVTDNPPVLATFNNFDIHITLSDDRLLTLIQDLSA